MFTAAYVESYLRYVRMLDGELARWTERELIVGLRQLQTRYNAGAVRVARTRRDLDRGL